MFSKSLPLVWSSFVIAADKYIPTNDYRLVVQFETKSHTETTLKYHLMRIAFVKHTHGTNMMI